jgi:hypothetical protein
MIKRLFLWLIRFYWSKNPENERRACLYKISCSQYVYRVTRLKGWFIGLIAYKKRMKSCKPGYKILLKNEKIIILTSNSKTINHLSINPFILE